VGASALASQVEEAGPEAARPLLAVNNIEVVYDHVILVLRGGSLAVPEGGIVALLGANGAGKTTTLKAISNLLHAERGEVTKGTIELAGRPITALSPSDVVKLGVVQVMEGRHCFEHLTVEENLLTGAYTRADGKAAIERDLELVYGYFPRLKERRRAQAGYASGGEQQMTAIGRALMARPKMILLDEPSMGLAPQLVEEIFQIVARLNAEAGVTFLLAVQNTNVALRYADFG
jgi:branched-chain amino acid transport system ATP-binding protein